MAYYFCQNVFVSGGKRLLLDQGLHMSFLRLAACRARHAVTTTQTVCASYTAWLKIANTMVSMQVLAGHSEAVVVHDGGLWFRLLTSSGYYVDVMKGPPTTVHGSETVVARLNPN